MSQNQCGTVDIGNHIGHCEGLSRTGDAQQNLLFHALIDSVGQLFYRLGLIAGRLIGRNQLKMIHAYPLSFRFSRFFSLGQSRPGQHYFGKNSAGFPRAAVSKAPSQIPKAESAPFPGAFCPSVFYYNTPKGK